MIISVMQFLLAFCSDWPLNIASFGLLLHQFSVNAGMMMLCCGTHRTQPTKSIASSLLPWHFSVVVTASSGGVLLFSNIPLPLQPKAFCNDHLVFGPYFLVSRLNRSHLLGYKI